MPEFAGHLHLTAVRRDDGATQLAAQSFRAPFHISKPYYDGRVLRVQVVNPTAGILEGDRLDLEIRTKPGAALCVTTPAATRAFSMRGGVATCRQQFHAAAGSSLEYSPEPLCPHAGTHFIQQTHIAAEEGAEVYFVDALAPGRVGRGERYAWSRLEIGLDLRVAGEPVLRERLRGDGPAMGRAAKFFQAEGAWLATVIVLTPRAGSEVQGWRRARDLRVRDCRVGLTALRHGGWVIRVIAASGQELRDALAEIRRAFAEDLPFLRTDLRKL